MRLKTRLTEKLAIEHPILLAPMGVVAGGRLAAAVSNAGGLGIIGGGYGDADWLEQQFATAGSARVGCGFVTWSMARNPKLLDQVLARRPAALMLSFGEVEPHASRIKALGVPLICQVQGMKYLREAVDAGADIIVAQGCEAGGHSGNRGLFTLVPEAADFLAKCSPDTVLVAAGGVGDGRGLAAALTLGADGVLVGTRFVASKESEVPEGFRQAIIHADGDSTMKSNSVDVVRKRYWPNPEFVVRVLKNGFVARWHGREREIEKTIDVEHERFWNAAKAGDADNSGVLMGEVSGIIQDAPPVAQIVENMVAQACQLLGSHSHYVVRLDRPSAGSPSPSHP
jgi:nitronate monooxygenase